MREGGTRRIVVPPGRLQQQGTKSLVWIAGLLDALEDAGGEGRARLVCLGRGQGAGNALV